VTAAAFDEPSGTWRIDTAGGDSLSAQVVVSGTGPLRRPSVPDLPGLARFAGRTFHSARWDHSYDLRGKRVAVVGTGASAIQFIPRIAPVVERLHIFQRTPPWIVPKLDRPFSEREKRVFERIPAVERLYRYFLYWAMESRGMGFVVEPRILHFLERLAHRHIRAAIPDPELRRIVTPSYRMGCKRILISDDYYPALTRPNVDVVTSGIAEIEEHAVVTRDGVARPVDAILFGTGFDVAGSLAPMRVYGLGGRELSAAWQGGAEAYYGLAVSGFPNFFLLLGPNSGLGHNSIIFMVEAQVHYIMECIRRLYERRLLYLDVLPRAQRELNERLQESMKRTIWMTGCQSWYLDERGRNFTLWPGFTVAYWLRTRRVALGDFRAVQ
jgi:cation diffusion facilitator CzcD-associated flavoprotein CzcO